MKVIFLLNVIFAFLISIFLVYAFFKHNKHKHTKNAIKWFSIVNLAYVALFLISFFWLFDVVAYNALDFTFIYSSVIFVQTLILFRIFYLIIQDKRIIYFLSLYLVSLVFVFFSFNKLPIILSIISFFLLLILFSHFMRKVRGYKDVGYLGIFYSVIALILESLLLFGIGEPALVSFVLNFLFLIFIFVFMKDFHKYPLKSFGLKFYKKEPYMVLFIRYFVFVLLLTSLVFISTIGAHEFGHVLVSKFFDCQYKTILYNEGSYPFTDVLCADASDIFPTALAGPIIPLLVAVFLFFIGGQFIKDISLLIVGFNLLASSKDLVQVGLSQSLVIFIMIVGMLFVFMGLILLARSRVHTHIHSGLKHLDI